MKNMTKGCKEVFYVVFYENIPCFDLFDFTF